MDLGHKQFKVGGLAIIINTAQLCNKHLIGSTVTVEQIVEDGDTFQFTLKDNIVNRWGPRIMVSGVTVGFDSGNASPFIEGYSAWGPEYLMPIGDDDEWQKLFEHEDNPYLVEA
ncbi:hypothetical protein PMW_101 [Pseudomonas phage phiPMW]|uniref:Uncharacterized protein n=1 Tax=Pseudomonas phage phiPMW TaxID=1815582 RepID=A0A1S5R1F1_9CAUD|nr:hypothetical protein FDG97_gp101 [Pseudomonas phage phiPMW]ANA49226.1 hypothetical protein PMW_101 [Pseudomonas phage phiPMW]